MKVRKFVQMMDLIYRKHCSAAWIIELAQGVEDEITTVEEKYPGMVDHLDIVAVIRNGLDVSAEAHAHVEGMRTLSNERAEAEDRKVVPTERAKAIRNVEITLRAVQACTCLWPVRKLKNKTGHEPKCPAHEILLTLEV